MTTITITTGTGETITLSRDQFLEVCEYIALTDDQTNRLALMLEFLAALKSEKP